MFWSAVSEILFVFFWSIFQPIWFQGGTTAYVIIVKHLAELNESECSKCKKNWSMFLL